MNEELIKMVLEECRRRWKHHEQQSKFNPEREYRMANSWASMSYGSVISMLEYALDGNVDYLNLFMSEEEPE